MFTFFRPLRQMLKTFYSRIRLLQHISTAHCIWASSDEKRRRVEVQIPIMQAIGFVIFVGCFTWTSAVKEENEHEVNINTILAPGFNCFKERGGVRCPPASNESGNGTKECVSRKDPFVHFYLFTWKNKYNPEYLHKCGGKLPENTYYDPKMCVIILIHGLFDGACRTAVWREIKDQLLIRKGKKCGVIILDWSRLNIPDIYNALNDNKYVAGRLCCLILNIIAQTGVSPKNMYLIGHSMGAHISGFTGQCVYKATGEKLGRITALDPSNFGYYGYPPDERLSPDDAKYIDVIHSNIGDCFPLHIGYKDNIGHADFYPNGGSVQFSCYRFLIESFLKLDIFSAVVSLLPSFCYHVQSLQYYKVSINSCGCQFVGVECKNYEEFKSKRCRTCNTNGSNCAIMGFDWKPSNTSRQYFLNTRLSCPYFDNRGIKLNGFPNSSQIKDPGPHCYNSVKLVGMRKAALPKPKNVL